MTKTTEELERDVAVARERLALAIRGLDASLTPTGLVDEAVRGFARGGASGAGRSFAMLAGYAGLKYALGRRGARSRSGEASGPGKGTARDMRKEDDMVDNRRTRRAAGARRSADSPEAIVEDAREVGGEFIEEALEQAGQAAEFAREGIEEAGAWAEERYREAADAGRRGYREARRFAGGHPFAVGAIGLAAGVVVGVLLARGGPGPAPRRRRRRGREEYDDDLD